MGSTELQTGFAVLAADNYGAVAGRKVGILANPTSVTADLRHEVDVMRGSPDIDLVAVFGPEHGFRGTAQAGWAEDFYVDGATGLPVYDLYGKDVDGAAELIEQSGIEVLIFDIQDVGARFYTYIWSMYTAMRAAAKLETPFVVLDRPNPLGGGPAAGPVLRRGFESGVGLAPIAQRHGMTIGELARMFNAEFGPGETAGKSADLSVIELRGWRRGDDYAATGLPWVFPSPNIPTLDSVLVYPGTGMFEGVNLSEGRGTTKPFELIGAPFVDGRWAAALNSAKLPGVLFREAYFLPTFHKFANETCGGVELHVTDRQDFDPIRTTVEMFIAAKTLYPDDFQWKHNAEVASNRYWIDRLSGSDYLRAAIDAGQSTDEVTAGWQPELARFEQVRERYLSY
ncbi:MAG TPA: DUF1343 domain-containing protein [Mycobacteriales bacterium]|jgi:uncharacterized protein YbbC (DUF1343 family)|nr:DUF1343 domain-containing protein [Mycobacteriales bacterium]